MSFPLSSRSFIIRSFGWRQYQQEHVFVIEAEGIKPPLVFSARVLAENNTTMPDFQKGDEITVFFAHDSDGAAVVMVALHHKGVCVFRLPDSEILESIQFAHQIRMSNADALRRVNGLAADISLSLRTKE